MVRSNAKAEFWTMAQGICEVLWIKEILKGFKLEPIELVKIYCFNKTVINFAHNPIRMKHAEVDRHFIKEKIMSGQISLFVTTKQQLPDILTKGISTITFESTVGRLRKHDIYALAYKSVLARTTSNLSRFIEVVWILRTCLYS